MPATRAASGPVDMIRKRVLQGRYKEGQFLPPIREIAAECGVSPETIRRGLKYLEAEGLLISEPRQGFRVHTASSSQHNKFPVAYVTANAPDLSNAHAVNWAISQALSAVASEAGQATLGVHVGENNPKLIAEQLAMGRAQGVVLDTFHRSFLDAVRQTRLPVVMVNGWFEETAVDVVLQDNYRGGFLAARHLVEIGASRIAWINPVGRYSHSRERYAGAVAGLASLGQTFDPKLVIDTGLDRLEEPLTKRIRQLFKSKNRPDGVLVFWKGVAEVMLPILRELDIQIGRELKIVGWSADASYESVHHALYSGSEIPPAIVWSVEAMAREALKKLNDLRGGGVSGNTRTLIPTRIQLEPLPRTP